MLDNNHGSDFMKTVKTLPFLDEARAYYIGWSQSEREREKSQINTYIWNR